MRLPPFVPSAPTHPPIRPSLPNRPCLPTHPHPRSRRLGAASARIPGASFPSAHSPETTGYTWNERKKPRGGGMKRKNGARSCYQADSENDGVDLNRNFGFKYAYDSVGSSSNGCSEEYRGTAAFSEPETRAIQATVRRPMRTPELPRAPPSGLARSHLYARHEVGRPLFDVRARFCCPTARCASTSRRACYTGTAGATTLLSRSHMTGAPPCRRPCSPSTRSAELARQSPPRHLLPRLFLPTTLAARTILLGVDLSGVTPCWRLLV